MAIGVAFGLMGAFFLGGMYVAGALGCLSLIIMFFFSDAPLWNIMASIAWRGNTSFILTAVPLFVLMGELMNRSGMGERMYAAISRWIWFLPSGLIHTNIVSCAIFAACSGSSVATSATISRTSLPSFRRREYSERMVIGSLAAGGTLGILIPPSISLIIYGVLVQESIGRLYMAGFVPGVMLALSFMVMIRILAMVWRGMAPREQGESFATWEGWRLRLLGTIQLLPIIALIFIVLGVIYMGVATPSEAAAFGVSGAFLLAIILNSDEILTPLLGGFLRGTGLNQLLHPKHARDSAHGADAFPRGCGGCGPAELSHRSRLVYLHGAHHRHDLPDPPGRPHLEFRFRPVGHFSADCRDHFGFEPERLAVGLGAGGVLPRSGHLHGKLRDDGYHRAHPVADVETGGGGLDLVRRHHGALG